MNKLANQISDTLTGKTNAVIEMAGKFYTVYPPITKLIARMLKPLSMIECVSDDIEQVKVMELTAKAINQHKYIDEVIALAILGRKSFGLLSSLRLSWLKHRLSFATEEERALAFRSIIELINPAGFFVYSRLANDLVGTMAKQKQE